MNNKFLKSRLSRKGFTFVEVLIAFVIIAAITVPMYDTIISSLKINHRTRDTVNANHFAQQMLETMKAESMDDWAEYGINKVSTSDDGWITYESYPEETKKFHVLAKIKLKRESSELDNFTNISSDDSSNNQTEEQVSNDSQSSNNSISFDVQQAVEIARLSKEGTRETKFTFPFISYGYENSTTSKICRLDTLRTYEHDGAVQLIHRKSVNYNWVDMYKKLFEYPPNKFIYKIVVEDDCPELNRNKPVLRLSNGSGIPMTIYVIGDPESKKLKLKIEQDWCSYADWSEGIEIIRIDEDNSDGNSDNGCDDESEGNT